MPFLWGVLFWRKTKKWGLGMQLKPHFSMVMYIIKNVFVNAVSHTFFFDPFHFLHTLLKCPLSSMTQFLCQNFNFEFWPHPRDDPCVILKKTTSFTLFYFNLIKLSKSVIFILRTIGSGTIGSGTIGLLS